MKPADFARQLVVHFPHVVTDGVEFRGEVTLTVSPADQIPTICEFARRDLRCDLLLDITSIDNYGEDPRWTLVYELYSLEHRVHLRLKTHVAGEAPELPTVSGIWRTAEWHEREIYDMMGIRFRGHPDLRRILMWEGYPYFPLRKDFPLEGKPSAVADLAFSDSAPMEGGPFVTSNVSGDATAREPRARQTGKEQP